MTLTMTRQQWAVGQGGFHTGRLLEDGDVRIRYVFDCGAMSTYEAARNSCIDSYIAGEGGKGTDLDYLFITHAHDDHLNGVKRLLDATKGMKVKVIVMPLLSVVDRLISYARTASVDPKAGANGFYRSFIVDPVRAVSQFGPAQIIQVRSNGEGGAPFSMPDSDQDFDGPFARSNEPGPRMPLKMVGSGAVQRVTSPAAASKTAQAKAKPQVWIADDSLGFLYRGATPNATWLLAPYVDPRVEEDAAAFMAALATERKTTVAELKIWLKKTSNLTLLLTHGLPHLVAAYHAVSKDLNVTSLSLYSGPLPDEVVKPPAADIKFSILTGPIVVTNSDDRAAWLGTGDAALKEVARRKNFLEHYGKLLEQVHTFVLPHHGSEGNFDVELLKEIPAFLCIAAADRFHKWRHPGTGVVQAVASEGRLLCVVTAAAVSQVIEMVELT